MDVRYTLDKLVLLVKVQWQYVRSLLVQLEYGCADYGVLQTERQSNRIADCKYNLTFGLPDGKSYYLGVSPNWLDKGGMYTWIKLEYNPAKVGYIWEFMALHARLLYKPRHVDVMRYDVAIDIPVRRDNVLIVRDRRQYRSIVNTDVDKTEYLGPRNNHGHVKLYNKSLESGLGYPLTRLEITMDYDRTTVQDFLALWPQVYCIDDYALCFDGDDLRADDRVLYLACREHPEYLKLLNKNRRKKIECILGRYTHELMPDINSYNAIISDVHRHCKPYIMDDWQEIGDSYVQLDFEQEKSFEKKFRALFGEQIEFEEQLNNN